MNNRSPDLDQSIVVNEELNDRRPTRFQPWGRARFVAFPIRSQTITGPTAVRAVRSAKSSVFCDDDGIMIESSQIESMSLTQRLQVIDQFWDSLNRCGDENFHRTNIEMFWLTGKRAP